MQRLSLLTFSRGYVDRVFSMIEDLYDVVDEIVLIDSSDKEERKKLHAMKKKRRWSKLKIVYIVPLGFVELYRPYGLSLCKNDWVLPLYADERISDLFKADINNIINNTKCSAFNIVRYENVEKGEGRSNFFTFQIQLIRKSKVRYKGLVDERPEVDGELCTLDSSKYYVRHITELMRHESNEYYKRGSKFREFEGISYHEYNERLLEHLSRLRGEGIEKTRGTLSGRALHKMILAYERMMRKRPEQEISDFDLFFFIMIKGFAVSAKAKSIRGSSGLCRMHTSTQRRLQK